ncbi:uncharacterized protein ACA1_036460 [Acanthamoeba castellanii str. Neff]|uniref:Uncharacterized protein n=1 Tax=Acanthamoeba castellanii (strain ATCC 30010 / Neff) TaxID=1257118 RepID=L8HDW5_ACACF|nr:uncharacterized protein ACA1_036460 [Acanthamoeba castellanii str. Neff]ELR22953.1 hypothetical protein ACA1_036460 [Acanthamoeba castellanii str. Neff]
MATVSPSAVVQRHLERRPSDHRRRRGLHRQAGSPLPKETLNEGAMRDRKTYTSAVIAFLTEQLRLNVSVTPPLADDTTTGDRFQLRLTSTLTGSAAANLSLPSSLAVLGGGQHFEADRTGQVRIARSVEDNDEHST